MDGSTILTTALSGPLRVDALDAVGEAGWEAFNAMHPEGSPFHSLAWRAAVREGLGYDTPYLIARAGERVAGILPLVHVRTPLFGNTLISTGFSVGGGILAVNEEVERALAGEAVRVMEARGARALELRGCRALFEDWPTKSETYAGFAKRLEPDSEARLKSIPRKKRADVRKGIKAGLKVDTAAPLAVFHDLYARNLHALGTPILPQRWYGALKTAFGENCEISTVEADGKPVVALLSLHFGETVYPYYVGAVAEARRLHAFDHVYWELMERAVARGCTRFDFGRSKYGTGAFDYKKHWGFEPEALPYQYYLPAGAEMPDVNPNNPKFAAFVRVWKKLPFAATKLIGPFVARQLG